MTWGEGLKIVLMVLLPVLLLPLLMRLFTGRLVLHFVKKRYLPEFISSLKSGWTNPQDELAVQSVASYVQQKLRYHFLFRFNFRQDIQDILLKIQNIYHPSRRPQDLKFNFPLIKLANCLLLAFCDLYREYEQKKWFKLIGHIRIIWFVRLSRITKHYNQFFSIPLFDQLRKTRLLWKIARILLIPLIGTPLFLWFVLRSLAVSLFSEGYLRFFYGILLLKAGYYGIYLYGRTNISIEKRVLSPQKIKEIDSKINDFISPAHRPATSPLFPQAVETYLKTLKTHSVVGDNFVLPGKTKLSHYSKGFAQRLLFSILSATKKHHPRYQSSGGIKDLVLKLSREIGGVYYPRAEEPLFSLRFREALELGYMAAVKILSMLYHTPGSQKILNKLSFDFVLKMQKFSRHKAVSQTIAQTKDKLPYLRIFYRLSRVFSVLGGLAAPYSLVFTFASPLIVQQAQDLFKEYLAHRAGRLILYSFERNRKAAEQGLKPILG